MFGPIDLPALNQESSSEPRNSSSYTDDVRYELPSDIMAQLPGELAMMIDSADKTPERYIDRSVRYYATYSDDGMCSAKSATKFESWEESFDTLDDCCRTAFSWDLGACLGR
jgi:hypothetical protein